MSVDNREFKEDVVEVTKGLVQEFAVNEIVFFDELMEDYFENPVPPSETPRDKDDILSFGIQEIVISVTPAIAAAVQVVFKALFDDAVSAFKKEGTAKIRERVKDWLNPEKGKASGLPLTKEQVKELYDEAYNQAVKFGVDPMLSKQIVDTLLVNLTYKT